MPQMRRDLEVWFWLVLSSMRVYNTPPWLAQAEGKQKLGFAKLSPKYLIRDSPDAVLASAALPSSQKILAADAVLNPPPGHGAGGKMPRMESLCADMRV